MDSKAQTELLSELEHRFHQLASNYVMLDAQIERQIVRWRYASRQAFALRFDYLRRTNSVPGELRDVEPTRELSYYAYGYDAQGRIVNESYFGVEELPHQSTFFDHHGGYTDLAEFLKTPLTERYTLTRVGRLVQAAKPLYFADYGETPDGRQAHTFERYEFNEQGRPLHVTTTGGVGPGTKTNAALERMNEALEQQRKIARILGTEVLFEQSLPQIQELLSHNIAHPVDSTRIVTYEYDGDALLRIVESDPL